MPVLEATITCPSCGQQPEKRCPRTPANTSTAAPESCGTSRALIGHVPPHPRLIKMELWSLPQPEVLVDQGRKHGALIGYGRIDLRPRLIG
jgi:hypothetical protein